MLQQLFSFPEEQDTPVAYKAFYTNISSLFLRCFLLNYIVDKTSYCRQDLRSISINIKTPVYMRCYLDLKVD